MSNHHTYKCPECNHLIVFTHNQEIPLHCPECSADFLGQNLVNNQPPSDNTQTFRMAFHDCYLYVVITKVPK